MILHCYRSAEFIPAGYIASQECVVSAAEKWFADEYKALKKRYGKVYDQRLAELNKIDDPLRRAIASSALESIPAEERVYADDLCNRAIQRLRNDLHQKKFTAYYHDGLAPVPDAIWSTREADTFLTRGSRRGTILFKIDEWETYLSPRSTRTGVGRGGAPDFKRQEVARWYQALSKSDRKLSGVKLAQIFMATRPLGTPADSWKEESVRQMLGVIKRSRELSAG